MTCTPGWRTSRYLTAIATKGFDVTMVEPPPFDPRIVAVDLTSAARTLRLVGVYGLTNGMTPESSHRRQRFQQQLLAYLAAIHQPGLCIAGDLNLIEPDHRPPLPAFEKHDYAFYTDLLSLGLRDAYRSCQPDGTDHSWLSPDSAINASITLSSTTPSGCSANAATTIPTATTTSPTTPRCRR